MGEVSASVERGSGWRQWGCIPILAAPHRSECAFIKGCTPASSRLEGVSGTVAKGRCGRSTTGAAAGRESVTTTRIHIGHTGQRQVRGLAQTLPSPGGAAHTKGGCTTLSAPASSRRAGVSGTGAKGRCGRSTTGAAAGRESVTTTRSHIGHTGQRQVRGLAQTLPSPGGAAHTKGGCTTLSAPVHGRPPRPAGSDSPTNTPSLNDCQ